ncbi:hypothetical protein [Malacoplasma muris]|uniref:hypothetical protein n=1 Tax=Malacoplasma muris TaxID=2119 RepID=UPI00398F5742
MGALKSSNKAKYNLANAWTRLVSKFFDLVIIIGAVVGLVFALFYNDGEVVYSWKVFLLSLLTFFLFFIWFIVIPFAFNGYTVFSALFKIKIYSVSLKNIYLNKWYKKIDFKFLFELIKRELFLWGLPSIIFLVFGIVSFTYPNEATTLIKNIIGYKSDTLTNVIGTIFTTLISLSLLCPLVIIINIIFTSKKRSLNDYFSNTVVLKMIDVNSTDIDNNKNIKQSKTINIKYGLPGEIDPEAIID